MNHIFAILFLFVSCIGTIQAQDAGFAVIDDFHFSPELLASKGIRSVRVHWEMTQSDDYEGDFTYTKERMEMDFDKTGNLVYRRFTPVITSFYGEPSPLGGRRTRYESFEFNTENRLKSSCEEYNFGLICEHFAYDELGQKISRSLDGDNVIPLTYIFQWKNGIMESANSHGQERNTSIKHYFNEQGEVSKIAYANQRYSLYNYESDDSTQTQYIAHYEKDSMLHKTIIKKTRATGQLLLNLKINANYDTVNMTKATYDCFGNVQTVDFFSQEARLDYISKGASNNGIVDGVPMYEGPMPEVQISHFTFSNSYENGLLVERTLVATDASGKINKEVSTITEKITYETQPLPARPWKPLKEENWDR